MSGGDELEGDDLNQAKYLLDDVMAYTVERIRKYLDAHPDKSTRLHKSYINRMLEWFSWHTVIVTSVEWENFFRQRSHAKAQKEIQVLSDLMREALDASEPRELEVGEWHTPLIQDDEDLPWEIRLPVSAARCARVSYLTHDGKRDIERDIELFYDKLLDGIVSEDDNPHWSPLEHVATPDPGNPGIRGNFGWAAESIWQQLRHYDPLGVIDNRPEMLP